MWLDVYAQPQQGSLCSTPVNPSQQLLQELQLSILLPSVLLHWAVDHATCTSSDSYRMHSLSLMCEEADCLLDYYRKVLQDGPASLYQHMTGQVRPGAEASPGMGLGQGAAAQPQVRVCLPAEVYATGGYPAATSGQAAAQPAAALGHQDWSSTAVPARRIFRRLLINRH